jgi:predicted DNA binding protein
LLTFLGGSLAESSFSVDCVAETDSAPCLVAIDDVTDLQLATVTFAVEEGYYDDPKDAQLSHIAAEFGCSKSAVSQRLTGVERKLVHSFVDAQGNTVG